MVWFLSFLWKRPLDERWHPADTTIENDHPVAYIERMRRSNPANEFHLMFFAEIPAELGPTAVVSGAIPRQPLNVR